MRADVKSELQMLREFFWKHAPEISCFFCGKPLIHRPPNMSFGHRRHPKPDVKITQHHEDEDRSNNVTRNLRDCHSSCHKSHHATKRGANPTTEAHHGEEEDESAQEG